MKDESCDPCTVAVCAFVLFLLALTACLCGSLQAEKSYSNAVVEQNGIFERQLNETLSQKEGLESQVRQLQEELKNLRPPEPEVFCIPVYNDDLGIYEYKNNIVSPPLKEAQNRPHVKVEQMIDIFFVLMMGFISVVPLCLVYYMECSAEKKMKQKKNTINNNLL